MAKETIPAEMFEARCLAFLDEVANTGKQFVITTRGRPAAKIVPVDESETPSLIGSVLWEKDLVSAVDEDWDAE